jgi:hypothetical protein
MLYIYIIFCLIAIVSASERHSCTFSKKRVSALEKVTLCSVKEYVELLDGPFVIEYDIDSKNIPTSFEIAVVADERANSIALTGATGPGRCSLHIEGFVQGITFENKNDSLPLEISGTATWNSTNVTTAAPTTARPATTVAPSQDPPIGYVLAIVLPSAFGALILGVVVTIGVIVARRKFYPQQSYQAIA